MEFLIIILVLIVLFIVVILISYQKQSQKKLSYEDFLIEETNNNSEIETNNTDYQPEYSDNYWIPIEQTKRKVEISLFVEYKNSIGEISERQFDITSFSRGNEGYHFHGYCHKKGRNITLSSLGILNAKIMDTGEEISDVISLVESNYKDTIYYYQDLLFENLGWAIYPLIYLAASSGSVVKKEREIIINFIHSYNEYQSLSYDWLDNELKKLYRPGKMEIRNLIKDGIQNKNDFNILMPWINKLENSQNAPNKEFQNLKDYIIRKTTPK